MAGLLKALPGACERQGPAWSPSGAAPVQSSDPALTMGRSSNPSRSTGMLAFVHLQKNQSLPQKMPKAVSNAPQLKLRCLAGIPLQFPGRLILASTQPNLFSHQLHANPLKKLISLLQVSAAESRWNNSLLHKHAHKWLFPGMTGFVYADTGAWPLAAMASSTAQKIEALSTEQCVHFCRSCAGVCLFERSIYNRLMTLLPPIS